jgi:hypothetical protein
MREAYISPFGQSGNMVIAQHAPKASALPAAFVGIPCIESGVGQLIVNRFACLCYVVTCTRVLPAKQLPGVRTCRQPNRVATVV